MLDVLTASGYTLFASNHAQSILQSEFPDALIDLEAVLSPLQIPIAELVEGGGGEGPITQRLRRAFNDRGWKKRNIHISTTVDGFTNVSDSHEVDHVKAFPRGQLLLEIEWNNKDPFYDRDLQNFKSLHAANSASVGLIITRGASLQESMLPLMERFLRQRGIDNYDKLADAGFATGTKKQRERVRDATARGADPYQSLASVFVRDKYGTATTHWGKLMERLERGMGRPCPLLCIGIPAAVVVQEAPTP